MENNPLSIDLKKIRQNLPPPPVEVPPIGGSPVVQSRPAMTAPRQAAMTPSAASPMAQQLSGMLPPNPRAMLSLKPMKLLSWQYMVAAAGILVVLVIGYYIYVNVWTKSPFGPTGGSADTAHAAAGNTAAAATSSSDLTEAQILEAVGKIMLLPSDETPTLAKVSDPAALQGQVFFKNAAVGDIVLMYPKSLRAIIYDPAQNKIIEVGPITAANNTATSTSK